MAVVDMCAHRLFGWPVEVRFDGNDAGPFQEADHETRGEHLGHFLKLRRFRVQRRYGFRLRYAEAKLMFNSRFQGGFQCDLRQAFLKRLRKKIFLKTHSIMDGDHAPVLWLTSRPSARPVRKTMVFPVTGSLNCIVSASSCSGRPKSSSCSGCSSG